MFKTKSFLGNNESNKKEDTISKHPLHIIPLVWLSDNVISSEPDCSLLNSHIVQPETSEYIFYIELYNRLT